MKYVSNNFTAILGHDGVPEAHQMVQDFLTSGPIGYALTKPKSISHNVVSHIWSNSEVGANGVITFILGDKSYDITREVIIKVLHLCGDVAHVQSYSDDEMRMFFMALGYSDSLKRLGKLTRSNLRKEWNFCFDCVGKNHLILMP